MHPIETIHAPVDEFRRYECFHFFNTGQAIGANLERLLVLRSFHFDDVLLVVEKNRDLQLRMGYVSDDSH